MKTWRRLELLLEDLPCEYDSWDYYETSDQLLDPLIICYESLVIFLSLFLQYTNIRRSFVILIYNYHLLQQSCGSGVLADGRLSDLIRRVATFGMVLMKLDLRQVCFILYFNL